MESNIEGVKLRYLLFALKSYQEEEVKRQLRTAGEVFTLSLFPLLRRSRRYQVGLGLETALGSIVAWALIQPSKCVNNWPNFGSTQGIS
jgi:hypothetical protein